MKTKNIYLSCLLIALIFSAFNINYAQELHASVSSPVYNGGLTALKEFIMQNTHHPEESNMEGIPAAVTLSYTISEKGKVEDIKILRGINAECDSAAVRVTQLITGWQAAIQWGKPVSVRVVMPVEFYIEDDNQKEKTIFGNVSDKKTGNPLEGTLVLVKNTSMGTITDKNGNYSIAVPAEDSELEFSSMGYESRSEKIGRNRTINIELLPEDLVIDFSHP